jgi:hypothetical protein
MGRWAHWWRDQSRRDQSNRYNLALVPSLKGCFRCIFSLLASKVPDCRVQPEAVHACSPGKHLASEVPVQSMISSKILIIKPLEAGNQLNTTIEILMFCVLLGYLMVYLLRPCKIKFKERKMYPGYLAY